MPCCHRLGSGPQKTQIDGPITQLWDSSDNSAAGFAQVSMGSGQFGWPASGSALFGPVFDETIASVPDSSALGLLGIGPAGSLLVRRRSIAA